MVVEGRVGGEKVRLKAVRRAVNLAGGAGDGGRGVCVSRREDDDT